MTPREKILSSAAELFYSQGYRATGINQLIARSGVAKATFYSHFTSKEELAGAYIRETSEKELEALHSEIARRRTPQRRFMAGIEILEHWLISTNYRGCPFLNLASEIEEPDSGLRAVGAEFYQEYRSILEGLTKELVDSDPKRYRGVSIPDVAAEYLTIVIGTIALCSLYNSLQPYHRGVKMVEKLL